MKRAQNEIKRAGYRVVHHTTNMVNGGLYPVCTCKRPELVMKSDHAGRVKVWCINCGDYPSMKSLDNDPILMWGQFVEKFGNILPTSIVNQYNESLQVDRTKQGVNETNMQVEVESDFVDAEFAKENPKFTISNEGEMQADKFAKKADGKKLVLIVKAGGEEKLYSPNKTSLRYLIEKLGSESKKWVGTSHQWEIVPGVVDGKKVSVVYIKGALKE